MPVYRLGSRSPRIHPDAFVHPDAVVIGDVEIDEEASIWPHAVLRGDYGHIHIGARTSIQDGTVVHATADLATRIGAACVVGHLAHLEGCTVEDHVLIGSGSVVLHRAVIHSHALVGAHATVTNDTEVPSHALALGTPAAIHPDRVPAGTFDDAVQRYVENARRYRTDLIRIE
ncbi:conserved hypothetical protein [Acidimicrobium ferrooxidans DSM 10331]|uniref:Gamma carbonic anhydrase family protein n=1 Tax=Acidimicrobium ferrooxidans (strain DSM 10331 / JCM 15462 / NBRC 103882 / ICP) TaxID=525909 RepID=C7LZ51_ACIFD|nr:gamma carbonic anhydrase family protein [Acidimicrobium ferrooxidans]ACU54009.1 conserved hypothetical protein [Acidimicrobium ferrooxidans DSM 10331]